METAQPFETPDVQEGDAQEAGQTAGQDAGEVQGKKLLRSGVDPREAARLRWEKDRARQADEAQQAAHEAKGQVVVARVPVQVGSIITSLAAKAAKGGVAEARELRAYLAEFPVETDTDVSALDRRTRQALLGMLIDDRLLAAYEDGSLDDFLSSREGATPADGGTPA